MWDVLYWGWGCVVLASLFGDKAWWLYVSTAPCKIDYTTDADCRLLLPSTLFGSPTQLSEVSDKASEAWRVQQRPRRPPVKSRAKGSRSWRKEVVKKFSTAKGIHAFCAFFFYANMARSTWELVQSYKQPSSTRKDISSKIWNHFEVLVTGHCCVSPCGRRTFST